MNFSTSTSNSKMNFYLVINLIMKKVTSTLYFDPRKESFAYLLYFLIFFSFFNLRQRMNSRFKFTLVKVTASKIAYTSLEMTKNEHFLTTSHRKVVQENVFRNFGYIMLLKNSSRLIRVINRTNSQPNWTRRSEKRYH